MMRMPRSAVVAFLLGAVLQAQSPPAKVVIENYDDYSKAMKEIAAQNTVLRKNLAGAPEGAAAASRRLEALFTNIQAYWEQKGAEDAIKEAKNAIAAAQEVTRAVEASDAAAAEAASKQLGATCMPCHTAHRERLTTDFYRIK